MKIYQEVTSLEDCVDLQSSLDKIIQWCVKNDMELNPEKCQVITFHRVVSPTMFQYSLSGNNLRRVTSVRDLGVIVSSNLSPEEHILEICKKANSMLNFIIRISRDGLSIQTIKILYTSLVRSHLEYASVIWSPYQIGHRQLLERIQTRFTRLIGLRLGFQYLEVPVARIQRDWGLLSLERRRRNLDIMFLYKLINNYVDCPELLCLIDIRVPLYSRIQLPFGKRHVYRSYRYHSVVPRLMRTGNTVSTSVDLFHSSISNLKSRLAVMPLE